MSVNFFLSFSFHCALCAFNYARRYIGVRNKWPNTPVKCLGRVGFRNGFNLSVFSEEISGVKIVTSPRPLILRFIYLFVYLLLGLDRALSGRYVISVFKKTPSFVTVWPPESLN